MKLIEGLKQLKDLERKASDYRNMIKQYCAISSIETPTYKDQGKKIAEWLQGHADLLREIEQLRLCIQQTNLVTEVTIELNGKLITKSIAAWIHRRRDLAALDLEAWKGLTDRNIREGIATSPSGQQMEIKIIRFYDPEQRDQKINTYSSEASIIDGKLEVVNAITDLLER